MQMQDEEREYQEFLAKTMKASKDFVDDYNKLSQSNKSRFQKELEIRLGLDIARKVLLLFQNNRF